MMSSDNFPTEPSGEYTLQTLLLYLAGCVDMAAMAGETNAVRLETAFRVAESELGVARLLDPEDVDVDPAPDEKSVMTYVAQFLHRYPEGAEGKVGKGIYRESLKDGPQVE